MSQRGRLNFQCIRRFRRQISQIFDQILSKISSSIEIISEFLQGDIRTLERDTRIERLFDPSVPITPLAEAGDASSRDPTAIADADVSSTFEPFSLEHQAGRTSHPKEHLVDDSVRSFAEKPS